LNKRISYYILIARKDGFLSDRSNLICLSFSSLELGAMMINRFITKKSILGKILLCGAAFWVIIGCASPPNSVDYPQPKPVDAKLQQQHYDLGLQQYSDENFGKAKESFQKVIEYGPNTLLGLKAQENLKKIERILKTLEEIEAK
jgi:hypothetical protein